MRTYTSAEVCHLVGIPYHTLDRWVRYDLIEGQEHASSRAGVWEGHGGPGSVREWTPAQVDRVREIKRTLEQARKVLCDKGLDRYARLLVTGVPTKPTSPPVT